MLDVLVALLVGLVRFLFCLSPVVGSHAGALFCWPDFLMISVGYLCCV
jgi:hypothetical protein